MRVVCSPVSDSISGSAPADLQIVLYSHSRRSDQGSVGASILDLVRRAELQPAQRAWDLLSIALSVVAADIGVRRDSSPDGWTREIDLQVAVSDPEFWTAQIPLLETQLHFLTTDLWRLTFADGGVKPDPPRTPTMPSEDCVALLSGGLDSLVGAIDLVSRDGRRPYLVSQVVRGDKGRQVYFASNIGGGLKHLQLNHGANYPGANERSQRSRSIIFFTYAVLLATALKRYHDDCDVTMYVCENGFISVNVPLTTGRLGSLSTRTAHPVYMALYQSLLDAAGLHVHIENPYQFKTKGEMLVGCMDQTFLRKNAHLTTSCSRFARYGYCHCGRCVPCLIRRAAFYAWGNPDETQYVYSNLSRNEPGYAGFDDVRSAGMAIVEVHADGIDRWLGTALSSPLITDKAPYKDVVRRGLDELERFLDAAGVQ